ncbi:P-loop containing nucleoside triphosphate hydrolase protein [Xylaria digitata]|nr:P-loop containing nucleoside triphosphate hydrolase protein [Xylaria digitata]
MATISLDPEAIEQLSGERKALLDAIDNLRKHGIGRFVDLPQIIVVGDQSSGKSSVLEAISRVRFPMKNEVCTRFPIELVLRTDPQTKIHVQIQPVSASTDVAYTFDETGFDKEDLPRIIKDAQTHLLRDGATFSEDVLRVEISSPDVPHLTLVDLPGFYHSSNENQSASGREIVDRLVKSYMVRKNSIILAVVSARSQVIMQKVLSEVKEHDKSQERTLGIITKPDLLIPDSRDEDEFIRLARNQEQSLQLAFGWHVLRNRSESETSLMPEDRDSKEKEFFDTGIWSAIPSNNRGVGTLRKKLANILLDHIRTNLNTLIKDIQENIDSRKKILERLGVPRSSPSQFRAHLDKIASRFQLLSLHAIEGNYSDEFFGGLYPDNLSASTDDSRTRKLRALVRDLNRTFAYVLATKGSRRIIVPDGTDGEHKDHGDSESQETRLPPFLRVFESQYPFDDPEEVPRSAVKAELEPLSSANQGTEFPGTTNDLLAVKLFQDQSRPWEAIARFHIDFLLRIAKSFAEKLVTYITGPDEKTCSAILLNIFDPFFEQRTLELERKLQELLYHFRSGYPQPSDAEFRAILARRHRKHLTTELLQNLVASRPELFTEKGKRDLAELFSQGRKSEFGVDNLIDKSETYYELSLRNFTDNVIILVIENCLIKDLPSILTTSAVLQMEDDMLERLAAESTDIQVERAELRAECDALQKGLDLCKTYRGRNTTVLPVISLQLKNDDFVTVKRPSASEKPASSSGDTVPTPSQTSSSGAILSATTRESSFLPRGDFFTASGAANVSSVHGSGIFGGTTSTNFWSPNPANGGVGESTTGPFGTPTTAITNSATGHSPFAFLKSSAGNGSSLFGNSPSATANSDPATGSVTSKKARLFSNTTSTPANKNTTGLFGTKANNAATSGSFSSPSLAKEPIYLAPWHKSDPNSSMVEEYRHICATDICKNLSAEELRLMNWPYQLFEGSLQAHIGNWSAA